MPKTRLVSIDRLSLDLFDEVAPDDPAYLFGAEMPPVVHADASEKLVVTAWPASPRDARNRGLTEVECIEGKALPGGTASPEALPPDEYGRMLDDSPATAAQEMHAVRPLLKNNQERGDLIYRSAASASNLAQIGARRDLVEALHHGLPLSDALQHARDGTPAPAQRRARSSVPFAVLHSALAPGLALGQPRGAGWSGVLIGWAKGERRPDGSEGMPGVPSGERNLYVVDADAFDATIHAAKLGADVCVSFATEAELRRRQLTAKTVAERAWRAAILDAVTSMLLPAQPDGPTVSAWAQLKAIHGDDLDDEAAWVVATALVLRGAILVRRERRYEQADVRKEILSTRREVRFGRRTVPLYPDEVLDDPDGELPDDGDD